MKHLIKAAIQHPLISGSGIIIVGSLLGNFFNFLFNLFMSRNLPVADYGTLASIISLMTLSTVPLTAITPSVVSFAGGYFANNEIGMVGLLYRKTLRYLAIISVLILVLTFTSSDLIAGYFNIKPADLVIYSGLTVALIYLGSLNSGLLQARLHFKFISFSNFASSFIKFAVGVLLVLIGYGVSGAVVAFLLSSIFIIFVSYIPLRDIFSVSKNSNYRLPLKEFLTYGIPSAISIFGLNALISSDLLLVKRFFSPEEAGLYAGMALVGKVIFFLTAPIGSVMYPLIVQKHARNESYRNTLFLAIILVFVPSLCVSIFYFLYPEFAITFFLKNSSYMKVSSLLGIFGIFIALYSVISLLTYYFLSIKRNWVWLPMAISSIGQIILLNIYHESFEQVIYISTGICVLLLLSLLLYFKKTS